MRIKMNTILNVISRQLLGAKYERAIKSLGTCVILFLAIRAAEFKITVSPHILFLTAAAFSAGIMWQALTSPGNADRMTGLFMLPFSNREMAFSVVLGFTGYTLITKTFSVLALFLAVCRWNWTQAAVSLLCACNGCFMAAAWYLMTGKQNPTGNYGSAQKPDTFQDCGSARNPDTAQDCGSAQKPDTAQDCAAAGKYFPLPLAVLWGAAILLSTFLVQSMAVFALIVLASLCLSLRLLAVADAYVFYRPLPAKRLTRHTGAGMKPGSIFLYLLRYLATNRSYLWNTAGLCVIAGVLPLLLGQFTDLKVMPLGFAILSLNTPVCTLLSCDPGLEQAVRVLPGQARHFCTRYCAFLSAVNMSLNSIYLLSWRLQLGNVGNADILTAFLFALTSAVLSVLLEWFYPVRNWKIETDLWHHPRKYIVPAVMMLLAGLISIC